MTISRVLARPMLSSIFVAGGIDALRHPDGKAQLAEPVVQPLVDQVPSLPRDTETLVRLNALVQIGAGTLLAVGKFRRVAAVALIGSLIPTTVAGHRFWEESDEADRSQQLIHLLKNLGLLGGLILAAVDTEGSPSLSWRAHRLTRRISADHANHPAHANRSARIGRAARRVSRAGSQAGHAVQEAAEKGAHASKVAAHAGKVAGHAVQEAAEKGAHASKHASKVAAHAGKVAGHAVQEAAEKGARVGSQAGHVVQEAAEKGARAGKAGAEVVGAHVSTGLERAGSLAAQAHDRLPV